jgi:hypothetical protein
MKLWLLFCFLTITLRCFAQEGIVTGIVFEKENKDRIATVNVHNITTGASIYDNLKGEFKINAKAGDVLVFSRPEFHPDTVTLLNGASIAVYMARIAIQLREVTIHDSLKTPEARLLATKQDYSKAYGPSAYSNYLSSSPGSGAGLSIDALYNAFSRSGQNAARLRATIDHDYQQNVIDFRFNHNYVGLITGLKDDKLSSFMFRYRPGYYTTITATDYEYISMIRADLRRFLRKQRTYKPQPLESK